MGCNPTTKARDDVHLVGSGRRQADEGRVLGEGRLEVPTRGHQGVQRRSDATSGPLAREGG